jgi:hypothetical protein
MGQEVLIDIKRKTPRYDELELKTTEDIIRMLPSWRKTLTSYDDKVIDIIEPVIQKAFKGHSIWIEYPEDLFDKTPDELVSYDIDDYMFNSERRIFPIMLEDGDTDVKIASIAFSELKDKSGGKIGFESSFIIEKKPKRIRHLDVQKRIKTISMNFSDEDMLSIMDDIFEWKKYNDVGDDIIDDLVNEPIYRCFPGWLRIHDLERMETVMTFRQLLAVAEMHRDKRETVGERISWWLTRETGKETSCRVDAYGPVISLEITNGDKKKDIAFVYDVCEGKGTVFYGKEGKKKATKELDEYKELVTGYIDNVLDDEVPEICMLCNYRSDLKRILAERGIIEDNDDDSNDEECCEDTPKVIDIIEGTLPAEVADPEVRIGFDINMNVDNLDGLVRNTDEYIGRYPWVSKITPSDSDWR